VGQGPNVGHEPTTQKLGGEVSCDDACTFSQVLPIWTLYGKCTRALTLENFATTRSPDSPVRVQLTTCVYPGASKASRIGSPGSQVCVCKFVTKTFVHTKRPRAWLTHKHTHTCEPGLQVCCVCVCVCG
jgi:hypothetical protein